MVWEFNLFGSRLPKSAGKEPEVDADNSLEFDGNCPALGEEGTTVTFPPEVYIIPSETNGTVMNDIRKAPTATTSAFVKDVATYDYKGAVGQLKDQGMDRINQACQGADVVEAGNAVVSTVLGFVPDFSLPSAYQVSRAFDHTTDALVELAKGERRLIVPRRRPAIQTNVPKGIDYAAQAKPAQVKPAQVKPDRRVSKDELLEMLTNKVNESLVRQKICKAEDIVSEQDADMRRQIGITNAVLFFLLQIDPATCGSSSEGMTFFDRYLGDPELVHELRIYWTGTRSSGVWKLVLDTGIVIVNDNLEETVERFDLCCVLRL